LDVESSSNYAKKLKLTGITGIAATTLLDKPSSLTVIGVGLNLAPGKLVDKIKGRMNWGISKLIGGSPLSAPLASSQNLFSPNEYLLGSKHYTEYSIYFGFINTVGSYIRLSNFHPFQ
jgi:hypothetical protein